MVPATPTVPAILTHVPVPRTAVSPLQSVTGVVAPARPACADTQVVDTGFLGHTSPLLPVHPALNVLCAAAACYSHRHVELRVFPAHEPFPVTSEGSRTSGHRRRGPLVPGAAVGEFVFMVNVLRVGLLRGAPHTASPSGRSACSHLPRGLVIAPRGTGTLAVTLEAGSRGPAWAQQETSLLASLFFPLSDPFSPRTRGRRPAPGGGL